MVRAEDFSEESLKDIKVAVLANVQKLETGQLSLLQKFVSEQGGGLLVTGGDKVDINWHNQHLAHKTKGLVPMESMMYPEALLKSSKPE